MEEYQRDRISENLNTCAIGMSHQGCERLPIVDGASEEKADKT